MKTLKRIITAVMAIALMVALVNPVTSEAAAKIKLNKTKATLTITDKKKKPAVTLKVTGTSRKAAWSTSNKAVATVKNGKVTAKKAGKATITCKVSGKKYTCKVTVADKRITLNKTRAELTITDKVKNPTVTLKVKNAKGKAAWSSSRESVATVSNGKVTAHEDGSATITCKVDGKTFSCKIQVVDERAGNSSDNDNGDGNENTGTNGDGNTIKKPYGCIHCWCGWEIDLSVPGGTDEENKAHDDHAYEHLMRGETARWTDVIY